MRIPWSRHIGIFKKLLFIIMFLPSGLFGAYQFKANKKTRRTQYGIWRIFENFNYSGL